MLSCFGMEGCQESVGHTGSCISKEILMFIGRKMFKSADVVSDIFFFHLLDDSLVHATKKFDSS